MLSLYRCCLFLMPCTLVIKQELMCVTLSDNCRYRDGALPRDFTGGQQLISMGFLARLVALPCWKPRQEGALFPFLPVHFQVYGACGGPSFKNIFC